MAEVEPLVPAGARSESRIRSDFPVSSKTPRARAPVAALFICQLISRATLPLPSFGCSVWLRARFAADCIGERANGRPVKQLRVVARRRRSYFSWQLTNSLLLSN